MAIKYFRIGSSLNAIGYDNTAYDSAIETDEPIKAGAPVDPNDVVRLSDLQNLAHPIGSYYLGSTTNPNTVLGFGTWSLVAQGQMLVGYKAGDPDFGALEATGGSKTHKHPVDVPNTTSGAPSASKQVDNNLDALTTDVADEWHTHDTDPASFDSGDNDALPPFFVCCVWKRTA